MVNEYRQIEVPFKELIKGVLESNELFFKRIIEIRPELEKDSELLELKQEMEIIKNWYNEISGN